MILIKDGRIIDPKRGIDDVLDIVIDGGKIAKIGKLPDTVGISERANSSFFSSCLFSSIFSPLREVFLLYWASALVILERRRFPFRFFASLKNDKRKNAVAKDPGA